MKNIKSRQNCVRGQSEKGKEVRGETNKLRKKKRNVSSAINMFSVHKHSGAAGKLRWNQGEGGREPQARGRPLKTALRVCNQALHRETEGGRERERERESVKQRQSERKRERRK